MSSQRTRNNVEEAETSHVQTRSDMHNATTMELLQHPSHTGSTHRGQESNSPTLRKQPLRKRRRVKWWQPIYNSFSDWWMGELLAILISIVAFLAIVIVLRKYNNRAVPKLAHGISVNFIVQTLATVSKSSLLLAVASATGQFKWLWMSTKYRSLQDMQTYDDASRGPLGALKLLASRLSL